MVESRRTSLVLQMFVIDAQNFKAVDVLEVQCVSHCRNYAHDDASRGLRSRQVRRADVIPAATLDGGQHLY
jgi:hypothetical protein